MDDDLLALIPASLGIAVLLAAWARRRAASPRRQMRRAMGAGAMFGAAVLILLD